MTSRRPLELAHAHWHHLVLPRSHVVHHPSDLAIRRLLQDALREGGIATATALERLAEDLVGRSVDGVREAAQIVAQALVEGRLVAITLPQPERMLAEVEVTDLRTLGGWDVDEPLRPPLTPHAPEPPEPLTWVCFEVVDERGVPADGRYRISLDARTESGELARRRHRFDHLRKTVQVDLTVTDLRWDDTASRPDAPWHDDDPSRPHDGLFSLEIVDDRGQPLHARFSLTEGDRPLAQGAIAHRWRRALPSGEPVTLELTELRPQGDPR